MNTESIELLETTIGLEMFETIYSIVTKEGKKNFSKSPSQGSKNQTFGRKSAPKESKY